MELKKVLIIGLGKIGMGYDYFDSRGRVLTHATAFSTHDGFHLVGGVDNNLAARTKFCEKFNVPSYDRIAHAMTSRQPDLVVISTPTTEHLNTIRSVLASDYPPQYILCEKPLSNNLCEAREIVNLCKQSKCQLYLNYFRNVEPGVNEIRKRLQEKKIQGPINGVVWYAKGILHSGLHFLALLCSLLGRITSLRVLQSNSTITGEDYYAQLEVQFAEATFIFLPSGVDKYFFNTIHMIAANGRLRYEHAGVSIYWDGVVNDEIYDGYQVLTTQSDIIKTDFTKAQYHVAHSIFQTMNGLTSALCTADEEIEMQESLSILRGDLF